MQLPLNFEPAARHRAPSRPAPPQAALPNSAPPHLAPVHLAPMHPAPVHPAPQDSVLRFVRHPRARRYLIRVTEEGVVRVTVPRWGSKREAAAFAERERAWIETQLARVRAERQRRTANDASGQTNDERHASEIALLARAKRELPPRLMALAAAHGLTVTRISIRNQRWRWGSCSRSGHICLNWRLVTMPDGVRDYVLIHELMHLKRMDHSPKFWKLVADACPGYTQARAWLRSQSARF
jgi:predicted metal-dependent hydrolase